MICIRRKRYTRTMAIVLPETGVEPEWFYQYNMRCLYSSGMCPLVICRVMYPFIICRVMYPFVIVGSRCPLDIYKVHNTFSLYVKVIIPFGYLKSYYNLLIYPNNIIIHNKIINYYHI